MFFFFGGGYHALPHVKYGEPYLDWEGEGGGGGAKWQPLRVFAELCKSSFEIKNIGLGRSSLPW